MMVIIILLIIIITRRRRAVISLAPHQQGWARRVLEDQQKCIRRPVFMRISILKNTQQQQHVWQRRKQSEKEKRKKPTPSCLFLNVRKYLCWRLCSESTSPSFCCSALACGPDMVASHRAFRGGLLFVTFWLAEAARVTGSPETSVDHQLYMLGYCRLHRCSVWVNIQKRETPSGF